MPGLVVSGFCSMEFVILGPSLERGSLGVRL